MFLCWENGIGFCWLLPYFSSVFQTPFLWAASCSWSRQIASHFDFLFQPCWLFINGSLALAWPHWPGLIGSLPYRLIFAGLICAGLIGSIAHWRSLAHWLIGSLGPHWLIGSFAPFLAFFRAFQLQPQDLRASGLFNLKLLVLELRFWLVKRSFFIGLFNSTTLASRAFATFSEFDLHS